MQQIELSGKNYPIRFDFRALKEYKAISGKDLLIDGLEQSSDNMLTLTYVALKSGYMDANPNVSEVPLTEEVVSKVFQVGDIMKVVSAFMNEMSKVKVDGEEPLKPGEIPGTA